MLFEVIFELYKDPNVAKSDFKSFVDMIDVYKSPQLILTQFTDPRIEVYELIKFEQVILKISTSCIDAEIEFKDDE